MSSSDTLSQQTTSWKYHFCLQFLTLLFCSIVHPGQRPAARAGSSAAAAARLGHGGRLPLTGPEAAAAAPASLRAAGPRRSAPTAPLAGLLAAPAPAPHRRDPERTCGRARRGGRAASRRQTRGAAAASLGPSAAPEEEAERKREAAGRGAASSAGPTASRA